MVDAVRPVHRLIPVKAGASLRSGQIISAHVDSLLSGGRVKLSLYGKSLIAKTSLFLKPGQSIRASVEAVPGGWRLRVFSGADSPKNRPVAAEITPRQLLSAALLRAGLPVPDAAELERQALLLGRSRGERSRLARLYAELRSKGADPSADFLEYLDAVLSPQGDRKNPGNHSSPQREWHKPPDAGQLADELGEKDTITENEDAVLQLFSGAEGHDGTWVVRRFSRTLDRQTVSVVVKFRQGSAPAMALTIQDGERLFEFLIEGLDPPGLKVYTSENVEIDPDNWKSFHDRLALMKILLSDTILAYTESDGFSRAADETSYILEAMDESS